MDKLQLFVRSSPSEAGEPAAWVVGSADEPRQKKSNKS